MRRGVVKDPIFYKLWALENNFCACCGRGPEVARFECWPGLSTHHIAKPGRSDEPCNLLRLCQMCHDMAEGRRREVAPGVKIDRLSIGQCLTLKLARNPHEFDWVRIFQLLGERPPDLEDPPEVLENLFRKHRKDSRRMWWRPSSRKVEKAPMPLCCPLCHNTVIPSGVWRSSCDICDLNGPIELFVMAFEKDSYLEWVGFR